jgi:DNA polymerase-1
MIKLKINKPQIVGRPTACADCPVSVGGRVLGHGPAQASWAIVGEAPGFDEVRTGEPFVGPTGKLLTGVLVDEGIDRNTIYITNAIKCRIPAGWTPQQKSKAAQICGRTLIQELQGHGVKYVLALGNVAMEALFGSKESKGITKSQGTVREHPGGFRVYPSIHPAAILHAGGSPAMLENLRHAVHKWAQGSTAAARQLFRGYRTIDKPAEAIEFIKSLKAAHAVVIDLETSGFSLTYDEILCMTVATSPTDVTIITDDALYSRDEDDSFPVGKALAELPEYIVWIGHNISFDLLRLWWMFGVKLRAGFDTMLAHYCLDENRGHDLKTLAARYCDAPDWEADIKSYLSKPATDSYAMLPRPVLYLYAAQDGVYTWSLYELFEEQLSKPENSGPKRLFNTIMMPGVSALTELSFGGVYADTERAEELRTRCMLEAGTARAELQSITKDTTFNPGSPAQVAHILYDVLHAPTFSQSSKGYVAQLGQATGKASERSTGKEQLERLMHWDELPAVQHFAETMLRYRTPIYTISHYVDPFENARESDERVHPSYLLTASVTGRLSSKNPNVMNMPREGGVRGCIRPMPGNVILSADYGQAELRALAMISKDTTFQQLYREGKDVHRTVSTWFYGPDYTKTQRVIAKAFVFGLMYGRGEDSIAAGFGIPRSEAREKMAILMNLMPRYPAWVDELKEQVMRLGYIETPLGRRRRFMGVTNQNWGATKRFAINSPVQGTSSDIMFLALIDIIEWIRDFGGRVLFPLHDALEAEVPEQYVRQVARGMTQSMLLAPQKVFGPDCIPYVVDLSIGTSLEENELTAYKE